MRESHDYTGTRDGSKVDVRARNKDDAKGNERRKRLGTKTNIENYLRAARRMTDARRSVPKAAAPPTRAMPMYPS